MVYDCGEKWAISGNGDVWECVLKMEREWFQNNKLVRKLGKKKKTTIWKGFEDGIGAEGVHGLCESNLLFWKGGGKGKWQSGVWVKCIKRKREFR
jgi:hypothetical protein